MYVCGTYLVMLVSPPGVSGSSATRSLFGGTSSLSSLKSKSARSLPDLVNKSEALERVMNLKKAPNFSWLSSRKKMHAYAFQPSRLLLRQVGGTPEGRHFFCVYARPAVLPRRGRLC